MNNDLKVSLENIIPLTYARDHFSSIVAEVQRDKLYILTKGGKPAIALIDVRYLEQITAGGFKKEKIEKDIEKIPEQVGKPRMLEHEQEIRNKKPEIRDEKLEMRDKRPGLNKPFDSAQGKPAGFAAPQPKVVEQPKPVPPPPSPKPFDTTQSKSAPNPPAPKKEEFDLNRDLPKDNPPDLSKKTIPITEKPEPAATVSNFARPDTASPTKPLAFPANEVKTPPAATAQDQSATPKIDVNFNQDAVTDQQEKTSSKNLLSPDDQVLPAQYAGEPANSDNNEEPDEMVID